MESIVNHCTSRTPLPSSPPSAVKVFGHSMEPIGLMYMLVWITAPICFLKQVVSVIQLVVACRNLAALDVVARSRQREQHSIS